MLPDNFHGVSIPNLSELDYYWILVDLLAHAHTTPTTGVDEPLCL